MDFTIRQETGADFPVLYDLIKTAFETAKVKDGDEQNFAENLRKSGNYIPELGLVAEYGGRLIGQVMFTRTHITQPGGGIFEVLMLAPVSVLIEYRGHGVAAALIREGFRIAVELGYKAVFLCGDPAYYMRLGFEPISRFGLTHKSIPEPYVMGYELVPGSLRDISGVVRVE